MAKLTHWNMGDEIACDNVRGDMSRIDASYHISDITCPDCLKIVRFIKRGFKAYNEGQYQYINEFWKDMDGDNETN